MADLRTKLPNNHFERTAASALACLRFPPRYARRLPLKWGVMRHDLSTAVRAWMPMMPITMVDFDDWAPRLATVLTQHVSGSVGPALSPQPFGRMDNGPPLASARVKRTSQETRGQRA